MPSWCPYLATPYECCSIEPQDGPSLFTEKAFYSFLKDDRLRVKGFVIGTVSWTISHVYYPELERQLGGTKSILIGNGSITRAA